MNPFVLQDDYSTIQRTSASPQYNITSDKLLTEKKYRYSEFQMHRNKAVKKCVQYVVVHNVWYNI